MHERTQKKGKKIPSQRNKMLHFQRICIIAHTGFFHGPEKQNLYKFFENANAKLNLPLLCKSQGSSYSPLMQHIWRSLHQRLDFLCYVKILHIGKQR